MARRTLALVFVAFSLLAPTTVVLADLAVTPITPVYTLQDLIDQSASLQVGPLTFSDFSSQATYDATKPGLPPSAAGISVQGVSYGPLGSYGLRFQGAWTAMGQQSINTLINYAVQSSADTVFQSAQERLSSGAGAGSGMAAITEGIIAGLIDSSGMPRPLYVYDCDAASRLDDIVSLAATLTPGPILNGLPGGGVTDPGPSGLLIANSVIVSGGGQGVATIGEFIDTFMVTSATTPEPATLSVLGIGALALLRRSRR